jgi:hypothetical protein
MLQRRADIDIHFAIPFDLGMPKLDIGCGPFEQKAHGHARNSHAQRQPLYSGKQYPAFTEGVDMEAEPESPEISLRKYSGLVSFPRIPAIIQLRVARLTSSAITSRGSWIERVSSAMRFMI